MPEGATTDVKSIVNSKYRGKYNAEQKDWLAKFLDENAAKTKEVTVKKPDPANEGGTITTTEKRADGVDVDALFAIAKANGLDVAKYDAQRTHHGFPGRFRMTVGNMLRRVIKQRHGMFNAGGTFLLAPAEMLTKVGARANPTHNQDGTKIVVAKAETAATEAAGDKPKGGKKAKAEPAADPNEA